MGLPVAAIAEGQPVDLILFDPAATTTFTRDFMQSKSQNTPFLDKTLMGRVDLVVLGGNILLERP
jgi:dihydroorotase